ncbi:MAG: parvulin-like protein peptidyl-prolyl isomerase [uncultured bacterium]|nr:MAG: parvulin-like protein peptidyl-prolyl isomerase [uncultured bacterium]HBR71353.1 hypothetical protein [Candidatus Moranbacteria bacterium]
MEKKDKENKINFRTLAYSGVIVLFVFVVALLCGSYYFYDKKDGLEKMLFGKISYPAVVMDKTNFIYISEIKQNTDALKRFYENQDFSEAGIRIDFSTEDGKKRLRIKEKDIVNKIIENKAIELLANKRNINITEKQAEENILDKLKEFGNDKSEAEKELSRLYGWNLDDFKKEIVLPDMYREKLSESVDEEINKNNEAKKNIEKAVEELNNGKDFSDVARAYSQGLTAKDGGELGWITKEQLAPEIAKIAFGNYDNKKNEIIESSLGYHIIRIEDIKKEDSVDMVRIRQIFTRKKVFSEWLMEQMRGIDVVVFMRDYQWNKDELLVEFKKEEMRREELEIREKSQGDASMIF